MRLLFTIIILFTGNAFSKEIVVGQDIHCTETNGCFETIQSAIDSANPGDTIVVKPGVYEEYVVIDIEGLRLRAQFPVFQNAKIINRELRSIIRVQATEKNSELFSGPNGVRIESDRVSLEGFQIEANNDVVVVAKDCFTILNLVSIRNNFIKTLNGVLDSKAPGIYSCNSQRLLIEDNFIFGAKGRQGHAIHLGRLKKDSVNSFNLDTVIQRNFIIGPSQSGIYGHIESALVKENVFYMKNKNVPVINLMGPNANIENRPTWILDNRYNSDYFVKFDGVQSPILKNNSQL